MDVCVVTFFGRGFLGVFRSTHDSGIYLFIGVTLIYAVVHKRDGDEMTSFNPAVAFRLFFHHRGCWGDIWS